MSNRGYLLIVDDRNTTLSNDPEKEIIAEDGACVFSAGPEGLLQAVAKLALEKNIQAQVSLERYMACGLGVCLGCMVKMKDGAMLRACREGPVFMADKIMWD